MEDRTISNPANKQEQCCNTPFVGILAKSADMSGHESDHRMVVALVEWVGTTPADVAKRAGMPASTVSRHFKRPASTRISQPTWDKLKAAFPEFPGWSASNPPLPEPNAAPFKFEGATIDRVREDCPVFGTALGAEMIVDGEAIEQTMLNQGEINEYRKRPPITKGVERVYGLYVQGNSMYPAHRDGALLFAQWDAPIRVDDDVVVYLRPRNEEDNGRAARAVLIKRLVRRTARYVELQQFTPALTFRIPAEDVLRIDRVLTTDDYA